MTSPQPDLSVCIVAWNGRELSLDCLTSLLEQTTAIACEIIFVDNGSDDGTEAAVRDAFPSIRLIRFAKNRGFPAANNAALRVATGRYCILLNNDMVFRSDALSRMVHFADSHPEVGVLGCRLRYPNGRIQLTAHGDLRWQDHLYQALYLHRLFPWSREFANSDCTYLRLDRDDLAVDVGFVAGAALMVRRDAMGIVGLLDERILFTGEDWEWCRRFARGGYRVVYYAGAEIVHYHGVSTIHYQGAERDWVRQQSILYMTATNHYVYRKLHPKQLGHALFSLAFRFHWLTRVLAHGVVRPMVGRGLNRGIVRGFLRGACMRYETLAAEYLAPGPAGDFPPISKTDGDLVHEGTLRENNP